MLIYVVEQQLSFHRLGMPTEDKRPRELVVQEQLLYYLESAYPNVLPTDELAELVCYSYLVFAEIIWFLRHKK